MYELSNPYRQNYGGKFNDHQGIELYLEKAKGQTKIYVPIKLFFDIMVIKRLNKYFETKKLFIRYLNKLYYSKMKLNLFNISIFELFSSR